MICHAKNRRVDFVLFAGDLFDSGYTGLDTARFVSDMLSTLDCPVIISPGNHDPYTEGGLYAGTLPKNVMVFTSEKLSAFYLSDINTLIHGYAFTSPKHEENPLEEGVNLDKSKINILCAHTDLDVPLSVYAPITSGQLAASGFDYAALGHVHRAPAPTIYGKTLTAYSGCLEGRSFDEPDFGGFMEVTVDDNTVKCEKISIAKHRYMIETLDITGVRSDGDIISRLRRHIALCDYKEDTALRVILTGALPPEFIPSCAAIADAIEGLYRLDLKDNTVPILDFDELERDMSIRGEFYRTLAAKIRSADPQEQKTATEALRIGLCALSGKPIVF